MINYKWEDGNMIKKITFLIIIVFTLSACSGSKIDLSEIMDERGYEDYSLTMDDFETLYAILEDYSLKFTHIDYPSVKDLLLDYINSVEVSDDSNEFDSNSFISMINNVYPTSVEEATLRNLPDINKHNEECFEYNGYDIIVYKLDRTIYVEIGENQEYVLKVDTSSEEVSFNNETIEKYPLYDQLFETVFNTNALITYNDNRITSIYDTHEQTLIRIYDLREDKTIIMNTHNVSGKYFLGLTDLEDNSISLELKETVGKPLELLEYISNEDNIVKVNAGEDIMNSFIVASKKYFEQIDTIIYD